MRIDEFLAENSKVTIFEEGQAIFMQGEQAEAAFYIIEGEVEIFQDYDGKKSIVANLGPDQIFGEMALLRFDEYTMCARVAKETRVYVITPDLLREQVAQSPPLIKAMLDTLSDRIHDVNQVLTDVDRTSNL